MSLATAGIHCTISQRLSGAMEECSIVRGRNECYESCFNKFCCTVMCVYDRLVDWLLWSLGSVLGLITSMMILCHSCQHYRHCCLLPSVPWDRSLASLVRSELLEKASVCWEWY